MPDIEALSSKLFDAVKEYLGRSLKSFADRLDAIEARLASFRQPEDGKPGERGAPGEDGENADPAKLLELASDIQDLREEKLDEKSVAQIVYAHLERLPKPKDGERGRDGKDVDAAVVERLTNDGAALGLRLEVLHEGLRDQNEAMKHLAESVAALKALPISPASFMIDDKGELVAVYPDGSTKAVGAVRGKDGVRGASVMDGSVDGAGQLTMRLSDGRLLNVGTVRGEPGKPGETRDGKPGRDAAEIKPLPTIDEAKSYPEGTYAAYRGGLIRAERATDPITDENIVKSGWRALMVGIAEESEALIDEGRQVERTTVYTDGTFFKRREQTSAMIYRGVWTDKDFCRGDTVTWDGSLWHCEKKTRDKPGLSSDWKLVAKRGRDGKDSPTKH